MLRDDKSTFISFGRRFHPKLKTVKLWIKKVRNKTSKIIIFLTVHVSLTKKCPRHI